MRINEIIIQAWIYGIVILSNSKFVELRKHYKIKARKMLSYFAKHNDIGNKFTQEGCVIPIHGINNYQFTLYYGNELTNEVLEEWDLVYFQGPFNLSIGSDNCFWVAQLNELEEWNDLKLKDVEYTFREVYNYKNELEKEKTAIRITYPEGKYESRIIGLKRKHDEIIDYRINRNYGFFIELSPVSEFGESIDPTIVDFNFKE